MIMNEFEETEITAEELCLAVNSSLNPLSGHFVEMLDGQEADIDKLTGDYIRWAAPTALLGRALLDQLVPDEDADLLEVPGLSEVISGCPDFDEVFQELLNQPKDRDLLVVAACSWMSMREGCDELLEHLAA